jgi:hypothetical protein
VKKELDHLNLLAIFHYVMAALTALFSAFPMIYVVMGIAMVAVAGQGPGAPPPAVGIIIAAIGGGLALACIVVAVMLVIAGRCLQRHTNRTFCFIVAIILCISGMPGIILGIFTIIVLIQPRVQELFEGKLLLRDPEDDDYDTRRPYPDVRKHDADRDRDHQDDRDRPGPRAAGDNYYAPRGEDY